MFPALMADGLMRRRDERFKNQDRYKARPDPLADKSKTAAEIKDAASDNRFTPKDFQHDPAANTCICPAGKQRYSMAVRAPRLRKPGDAVNEKSTP